MDVFFGASVEYLRKAEVRMTCADLEEGLENAAALRADARRAAKDMVVSG